MKSFLVLGTEKRQRELAQLLYAHGDEVTLLSHYIEGDYDAIVLPVPIGLTREYGREIRMSRQRGLHVFGNRFEDELKHVGFFLHDYSDNDKFLMMNAKATAEGAICELMQHSPLLIEGSTTLVIGYGRCGKEIARKLRCFGSEVTILEHDCSRVLQSENHGFRSTSKFPEKMYDHIINTAPAKVLTERELSHCSRTVTIIDIATGGGVDYEYCRKNEISAFLCPGLPGKYAPKTSARILLEVIEEVFHKERTL